MDHCSADEDGCIIPRDVWGDVEQILKNSEQLEIELS
jgi:hypothetical protein